MADELDDDADCDEDDCDEDDVTLLLELVTEDEDVTDDEDVTEDDELVTEDEDVPDDDVEDDDVTEDDDDVALDELLLDTSSLTPPRRQRRCNSSTPAVSAATVIFIFTLRSAVSSTALAAVPSGVMSCIPSVPQVVIAVAALMSAVAPTADSAFRAILAAPEDCNGSTTWITPSKMIVPAGRVTSRSYQPTPPPSSVKLQRAITTSSGFHFWSLAS